MDIDTYSDTRLVSATPTTLNRNEYNLVTGAEVFIEELVHRLYMEESFDNPKLHRLAENYLHGSRSTGTVSPRDIYDMMETAANLYLLRSGVAKRGIEIGNPKEFLDEMLYPLYKRLPRQTDRTPEQVMFQQFSTPPTIAYLAARALSPQPGEVAMEPSAGTGSLAIWLNAAGCETLTNEIAPRRHALLQVMGFTPTSYDGEHLHDLLPAEIRPTAFLTNPPFSATGGRVKANRSIYGAKHLTSDLNRLSNGGRLVAIASSFMALDRPGFTSWWRQIINRFHVRVNLALPGNEYSRYGTSFETQLIVIDKSGPTPGDSLREQLQNIVHGKCSSLQEAFNLIEEVASNRPTVNDAVYNHSIEEYTPIIIADPYAGDESVEETQIPKPDNRFDALEIIPTVEPGTIESSASVETANDESIRILETSLTPIYVPYVTRKLTGGCEHPAQVVEASTMACVDPPDIHYRPQLPSYIISEGRLSRLQLERVCYAGQRHEQRLFNGARAGFFLGDGTGVGKGRSLGGIILDNWNKNRRRALWLSTSQDLIEAARRDLQDIGAQIPLSRINDYSINADITLTEGIVFCTYSTLITKSRENRSRLNQLTEWLDPDSVIILDESHKAKNAFNSGYGKPTQTGQAIIELQHHSPDYRIVYSSATGATDVRHMAYMTRLGLFGEGTSFRTFEDFLTQVDAGGVGAMELICRDLKAMGAYLSASISFEGVEYRETKHQLTPAQRQMYNAAANAWQQVLRNFNVALLQTNAGSRQRGRTLQGFWARHQRFFKLLISSFKVPTVIRETESALNENRSVIISLIGTGESRTREQVSEAIANGGTIEDLDFSPLEIICEAVNSCFPTVLYEDVTDELTGRTIQVPVERDGEIIHSQQALALKQQLLDELQVLVLPENPLDQIINYFGASNVAEITGRKRRPIRNEQTGEISYSKRAPDGVAMSRTNLHEMEGFQSGRKRIAIISKASATGISLHSSNKCTNKQRREFITLELSWSADEQMQMFGRAHRTDQAHPPIYNLISSELGGEVRFSSTIARRLGSLGALTKGDRSAIDSELAKYNFETCYGRAALQLLFSRVMGVSVEDGEIVKAQVPGLADPEQALRDMGLLERNSDGIERVREEDREHVPRFLNRVLALDVERQNAIFSYFTTLFDDVVAHAKSTGTFDEGVQDIRATSIRISRPPTVVHTDTVTGAVTTHLALDIETPTEVVTYDEALERLQGRQYAFYEHKERGDFIICTPSSRHTDRDGNTHRFYALTRPHGWRVEYLPEEDLLSKYRICHQDKAGDWWQMMEALLPATRIYTQHIISGLITPLWERMRSKDGTSLKVVRVTTDAGERVVGVAIKQSRIASVLQLLGISHDYEDTPGIFRAVLEDGAQVELINGMILKRSTVAGEQRIELTNIKSFRLQECREMGLINEIIKHRQRFFISTSEDTGCEMLTRLLTRYPPIKHEKTLEVQDKVVYQEIIPDNSTAAFTISSSINVFDLQELINTGQGLPSYETVELKEESLAGKTKPSEIIPTTREKDSIERDITNNKIISFIKVEHNLTSNHTSIEETGNRAKKHKRHVADNQLGFAFLDEA
jgi:hypothetical protein